MRADTFADVIATSTISRSRLDLALARHCEAAIALCDGPRPPMSRATLRDAVLDALPQALNVGLRECAAKRGLQGPIAAGPFRLSTTAGLDFLRCGLPTLALRLRASLALEPVNSTAVAGPTASRVHWTLSVGDMHGPGEPALFAEGDCEAHVDPIVFNARATG